MEVQHAILNETCINFFYFLNAHINLNDNFLHEVIIYLNIIKHKNITTDEKNPIGSNNHLK